MPDRSRLSLPLLAFSLAASTALYAQALPTPEIFAPGIISGPGVDGAPSFTPDGKTLFFTRSGATWATILQSKWKKGHWSPPQLAPFSGHWSDMQPVVSPDGSYLLFASWRPQDLAATTEPTPRISALWRVNRTANGWSVPTCLPASVNLGPRIFKPSIAGDNTLYYMEQEHGKKFRIFSAHSSADGTYQKGEPLPFSDGTTGDVDPEIAPDQSFLIFSSDGRSKDDTAHEHLYFVAHENGRWGAVIPLHVTDDPATEVGNDNEAHLARDGKTLYFSSDRTVSVHSPVTFAEQQRSLERLSVWDNGNYNAWSIPIGSWLETVRAESLKATP